MKALPPPPHSAMATGHQGGSPAPYNDLSREKRDRGGGASSTTEGGEDLQMSGFCVLEELN